MDTQENQVTQEQQGTPEDVQTTPEQSAAQDDNSSEQKEPNLQDVLTELAKVKRKADKFASENARLTKELRERMSVQEKADAEKAEKEAEREEQFNQLIRENNINKVEKNYLSMGFTADEAARMAVAEVDNDLETKMKIMSEADSRKKKEYEAEFIRTRPNVNVGTGDGKSYTKEQFDNMSIIERTKLKRENEAEYNRLLAL